jgi:hypothetical protein
MEAIEISHSETIDTFPVDDEDDVGRPLSEAPPASEWHS